MELKLGFYYQQKFGPSPSLQMAGQLKRKIEAEFQSIAKRARHSTSSPPSINGDGGPVVLITGMSRKRAEALSEVSV